MSTKHKVVFACIYTSYFLTVLVKRSVTYALPDIGKSEGLDKNQMGLILSAQLIAYAASKFVCGVLLDVVSPQLALTVGLLLQGFTAFAFANVSSSITMFTLLWMLNGVAAGTAWPAAVKILKQIFRKDQLGTAWSVLSTSINVAGTAGPLFTAYIITYFGWRTSIALPGVCSVIAGPFVYFVLEYSYSILPTNNDKTDKKTDSNTAEGKMSRLELFKLPGYGSVCFTYGLISLLQFGTLQWVPIYLVNDLGHSIITGNSYTSAFEIGGMIGSLLAGYSSDYMLSKIKDTASSMVRQYVVAWFTVGLVVFLILLIWCISAHSTWFVIVIVAFGIGFSIYGPVSILGVAAMECAPNNLSSLAFSVCSLLVSDFLSAIRHPTAECWHPHGMLLFLFAVGQALAGLPLGFIIKQFGWNLSFYLQLTIAFTICVHLFCFTRNIKLIELERIKKE